MDALINQVLSDRYEIVELIGAGGMANVYKARCRVLNRFVAVKILKSEYRNRQDFIKRFKTESRAVALLNHPNIVSVYDVGIHDGLPFIVMELIEGITLKEYISQKKVLSAKEAVFFGGQIISALEQAHSRKIIHRDIKPQNIMVLRNGTIKVADFGIARFTLADTQTLTESAIGSVHYLAPEQAKGNVSDERTDLYSVGVVLYEMVTGRVPFDADNPVMVAMMHLQRDPIPPCDLVPDVPDGLQSIILKAMMRDPDQRYQSASQMLQDLEIFRKNPAVTFEYKPAFHDDAKTSTQMYHTKGAIRSEAGEADAEHAYSAEDRATAEAAARRAKLSERNRAHAGMTKEEEEQLTERGLIPTGFVRGLANRLPRKTRTPAHFESKEEEPVEERTAFDKAWLSFKLAAIGVCLILLVFGVTKGYQVFQQMLVTGSITNTQNAELTVPNFKGQNYLDVATGNGEYAQFDIQVDEYVYDELIPSGQIVSQKPTAGSTVRPGATILVKVSKGDQELIMPDIVNQEYRTATLLLNKMGLKVEKKEDYNDEIVMGYIIKTDPVQSSTLQDGDTVVIYVSLGKEMKTTTVPTVTGVSLDTARNLLTQNKLVAGKVAEQADSAAAGTVIAQSVTAQSQVEENTVVDLTVSTGPAMVSRIYHIDFPISPNRFLVEVYQDGLKILSEYHNADEGSMSLTLQGSGSSMIEVFIDGSLRRSEVVYFD